MKIRLYHLLMIITLCCVVLACLSPLMRWYHWQSCVSELHNYQQQDFIRYGRNEFRDAARPLFDQLLNEAQALPWTASDEDKLTLLKRYTIELGKLCYRPDILGETVEFEAAADVILEIANRMQVDLKVETYTHWRDVEGDAVYGF